MTAEAARAHKQKYILQVYASLAFLSFSIFGSLHVLVEGNEWTGYAELGGAAAVVAIMLLLKANGSVAAARACLLLTMTILLFVMLVSGGTQGTGIFWFFMFPVAAFFLAGAREGVFWMLLLAAVVVAAWVAGEAHAIPFYYRDIDVRQLVVTLAVVTIGLFVYQRYREVSEDEVLTSHKKLQASMRQTVAMHDKMDEAKSEFMALASHQLRTPISAVRWSSEMLLNGDAGKLNEDQRESIQGIEDSSHRLAGIVDTMLLISSLDLGNLEIRVQETDLAALSHKTLAAQQGKYPDKRLEISQSYESDLPKLHLDARLTAIILDNIFSNAIKYTPAGGKIDIQIKRHDEKLSNASRGSILIEVTDSGYGIPVDQQVGVFNKMFRATNIKTKDTDGTGLGLYVVKAILEHVGGKIWFESVENKGSTFSVLLPLEDMKQAERTHRTQEEADV